MAPRSVRWRSDTSRRPSVESSHEPRSRNNSSAGGSSLTPRSDQFDGQRQAVQPSAQLGHSSGVVVVDREVGLYGLGALGEQDHGCIAQRIVGCEPAAALLRHRQSQGAHRHLPLAAHAQRLAASDQHMQPGTAPQQVIHQRRGRDDLLEVVQRQQQVLLLQPGAQLQVRRIGAAHLHAQRLGDGRSHQRRVADRSQTHEESAVLKVLHNLLSHSQGQTGLADAGRADQCHQPCAIGEQPFAHDADVMRAADEWGELSGEVVGALWAQQARPGAEVVICAAR